MNYITQQALLPAGAVLSRQRRDVPVGTRGAGLPPSVVGRGGRFGGSFGSVCLMRGSGKLVLNWGDGRGKAREEASVLFSALMRV